MENREPNLELTYASSIENIDFAFYDWIDNELNLHCNSKDGFKKVPTIWVTPERAYQVKQNKEFRDINGTLNVPMLTVERTSINKDVKNNATFYTNLPPNNNRHVISRRINQKKTSEFASADANKKGINFVSPKKNEKIVYKFSNMLLPVYVTFTYNITIFTQFQQQMNEILQPFLTRTGSLRYFLIERNGYKYECFIEPNFETKNNISSMEEEERRYMTSITIKVLGNLVSDGVNEKDIVVKVYENIVDLKFPKSGIEVNNANVIYSSSEIDANTITQTRTRQATKKMFLVGNNSDSTYKIIHNLNTKSVSVDFKLNQNYASENIFDINPQIIKYDVDFIEVDFGKVIKSDYFYVTIIG